MKHPKWLLVLVIILLAINIIFFTLWYALDVQGKVRAKVEVLLSTNLGGSVSIRKLTFNDHLITANNVSYLSTDRKLSLKISQIQIRYNLLKIIFSGFKVTKAINDITLIEPDAIFNYNYLPSKSHKKTTIPDLTDYFRKLTINKGKLRFSFSAQTNAEKHQSLFLRDTFSDIEVKVTNHKASNISMQFKTANGGAMDLGAILNKGLLTKAKIQLISYKPSYVHYSLLDSLNTEVSVVANYSQPKRNIKPKINYNLIVWNSGVKYQTYTAHVPYANIVGNLDHTRFEIAESRLNSHKLKLNGDILNPLKNPFIKANVNIVEANLSELSTLLTGFASGNVKVSGYPSNISANAELQVPELTIKNEIITDVSVTANLKNNILNLSKCNLIWQNQSASLSGVYNIKQKKANLICQSNPVDDTGKMSVRSDFTAEAWLENKLPYGNVTINNLDFHNPDYNIDGLHGSLILPPNPTSDKIMPAELTLSSPDGINVTAKGDILNRSFTSQITLTRFQPSRHITYVANRNMKGIISGITEINFHGSIISGKTDLTTEIQAPVITNGSISSTVEFDFHNHNGFLNLETRDFVIKQTPFSLKTETTLTGNKLNVQDLNINNEFYAKGWLNLKDLRDASFTVKADSLSFAKYWNMFDPAPSPITASISMDLDYNSHNDKQVSGDMHGHIFIVDALQPFDTDIRLSGMMDKFNISADISKDASEIAKIDGFMVLSQNLQIDLKAKLDNSRLEDILKLPNTKGILNGDLAWNLTLAKWKVHSHTFAGDISGQKILVSNILMDSLKIDVAQTDDFLRLDNLLIKTNKQITVLGNGGLDYNLLRNSYTDGNHTLHISIDGDALHWLQDSVPYIENAKGVVKCQLGIQAKDDGIHLNNGMISLTHGVIKLKDQVESITDIEFQSTISNDVLSLDKCSLKMGNGRLYIRNAIDSAGENFYIGQVNLGYLLIRTDDNGIQVYIPQYIPKGTEVTAILKGQNGKEATVKGPFDDMKISGEVICSSGSVVYPANSRNLMQLIENFRKNFNKAKANNIPLPFVLDLLIKVDENVRYVTYPANFVIQRGSYLRLVYDGNLWGAPEGEFNTEQGTLDFFGTIFTTDFVKVVINEKRHVVSINGTMISRTPDGSTITLHITTNPRKGLKFWDQLEFSLSSDNPNDKTSTQILSRLRYNRGMDELTPDQRQSLLQDEALQLVGSNLNTSLFGQVFSPVENTVRRFLHLDSFTISTGFVQNLFVQYGTSNSNQQKASFSDPNNLNSDIMQFSSSVFLNNFSMSMGKYLGRSMFLDYQIRLQETTNLQKSTGLDLYHDATLRVYMPWKLKLAYTFSVRPAGQANAQQIMVQRSFMFWGLWK